MAKIAVDPQTKENHLFSPTTTWRRLTRFFCRPFGNGRRRTEVEVELWRSGKKGRRKERQSKSRNGRWEVQPSCVFREQNREKI